MIEFEVHRNKQGKDEVIVISATTAQVSDRGALLFYDGGRFISGFVDWAYVTRKAKSDESDR